MHKTTCTHTKLNNKNKYLKIIGLLTIIVYSLEFGVQLLNTIFIIQNWRSLKIISSLGSSFDRPKDEIIDPILFFLF